MSELDKKTLIHIAGEVVVVGGLAAYLVNRIAALEAKVAELEKDLQATARHTVSTEKKQNEVLNAMGHLIKTTGKPQQAQQGHSMHSHQSHTSHPITKPPTTTHARPAAKPAVHSQKKTISFSDEPDLDDEDEESDELAVQAPVKTKTKPAARSKGIKVSAKPAETGGRKRNDMSTTKAEAMKLAPSDDEE